MAGRKFRVRTYVLTVGGLKIYVYRPMLALFAGEAYTATSASANPNDALGRHLTNTCLQRDTSGLTRRVSAFDSLPAVQGLPLDWKGQVLGQICTTTAELFEAAARTMGTHFQPMPNAFEIFGLRFLVDHQGKAWTLEMNTFPDFRQTGDELKGMTQGLMECAAEVGVQPLFEGSCITGKGGGEDMIQVLAIDLGRQ